MKLKEKQQIAGVIIVSVVLLFALAVLDYSAMHMQWDQETWLYKYWMGLALTVTVFAFALSYVGYTFGMPTKYVPAVFLTVMLLFVAGVLDLFYYALTFMHGTEYSFKNWSFQWKVFVENGLLSTWDWPHQIVWSIGCFITIFVIWHYTLKGKRK